MPLVVIFLCIATPSAARQPDIEWRRCEEVGAGTIRAISWLDARRAWMATGDGSLLQTDDGGRTWRSVAIGPDPRADIRDIAMQTGEDGSVFGWAVARDGRLLHSPDADRWQAVHYAEPAVGGGPLTVLDERHIWLGGPGALERTRDGGETWERLLNVDGREIDLRQINSYGFAWSNEHVHFRNADEGTGLCATSEGWAIRTTRDGGEIWTTEQHITLLEDRRELIVLESPGAQRVYGMNTLLYEHGELPVHRELSLQLARRATWSHMPAPDHWPIRGMGHGAWRYWIDSESFIASLQPLPLEATSIRKNLFVTEDAGQIWQRRFADSRFTAAAAPAPRTLVVVGEAGRITRTGDSGNTWSHTFLPDAADLAAVCFAGPRLGWVAGAPAPGGLDQPALVIWRTDDAGLTWKRAATIAFASDEPHQEERARAMLFRTADQGWIVTEAAFAEPTRAIPGSRVSGEYGRILRTTDGGLTWTTVHQGSPLGSIARAGDALVAAGCDILRSEDGIDWREVATLPGSLYSLHPINTDRLIGIGEAGLRLATDDGGRTWRELDPLPRHAPRPAFLHFATPESGWQAVSGSGAPEILATTDGGHHWRPEPIDWRNERSPIHDRWIEIAAHEEEAWAITPEAVLRRRIAR